MSGEHDQFVPPDYTVVKTFQQRVEAHVGFDFGALTDPSEDDLSIYLRQANLDVIERVLALKPDEAVLYARTWVTDSNKSITKSDLGKIVAVTRESGTADDWRPCRYIDKSFISRVTDSTSIYYASKFNPTYSIGNEFIEVYPAPDNEDDRFRVITVNNHPTGVDGHQLSSTSFGIKYYPKNKEYLVVLYASVKSLDKLIAVAHDNLPSNLSISARTPVLPTISDNSFTFSETAPQYVSPNLTLSSEPDLTAPSYTSQTASPNYSDADTWINTEEDPEMAASRVQVIQSQIQKYGTDIQDASNKFQQELTEYQKEQKMYELDRATNIQKYTADIQNALNKFNKENTEYQILFNKELQNATIKSKDDDQKIQKYSSELQRYAADVNKEVQEFQSNLQRVKMDIEIYQARNLKLQKEYDDAFIFMAPKKQQQESKGK